MSIPLRCTSFLVFILSFVLPTAQGAASEEIDRALSEFSESLAAQVRRASVKKIAVPDLADLQGKPLMLGAFIAEETTVNLVSSTNAFTVVDRANLNKILAEHKLSRTGLEQPENIKKLGHFSGVDAIVLGTLTVFKSDVRFTAKIISTETADIMGAAKGQIPRTPEIEELLKSAAPEPQASKPPGAEKFETNRVAATKPVQMAPPKVAENSKQIEDLLLQIESMRLTGDQYTGNLLVTAVFRNMSTTKSIGVGMFSLSNVEMESKIYNDKGDEFSLYASSMSGLPWAISGEYLAEIKPEGTLEANLKYFIRWNDKNGNFGPYRFQAVILVGDGDRGRYGNVRKLNFNIAIPTAR